MLYEPYFQRLGTVEDTNVCGAVVEEMLETARRERPPVAEVVNALKKVESHLIGEELWSEETYTRLERWIIESWPEATPQEAAELTRQLHPLEMPRARRFIEAHRDQLPAEEQERLRAVLEDWEASYSQISYLHNRVHRHSLALWARLHTRHDQTFSASALLAVYFAVMGLSRSIRSHSTSDERAPYGARFWFGYPPGPERLELAGAVETLAARDPAFAASEIGQKTLAIAKDYLSVLDRCPVEEAPELEQPGNTFRRRLKNLFRSLEPPSSGKG